MFADKSIEEIELVMQSMVANTRDYFENEHNTRMSDVDSDPGNEEVGSPTLLDMTAVIGLGGLINLQAVFSFQTSLVNVVYAWMTVGFFDCLEDTKRHREAAIGELVNTVLGHCTVDLQHLDRQGIPLMPPVIFDPGKVFPQLNSAVFARHCLQSKYGRLNISLVGPKEVRPAIPESLRKTNHEK